MEPETALVGIHTGGVWVAERLHQALGLRLPLGTIDVAFYRDDYKKKGLAPGVRPSDIRFPVEDAQIILVDDVLYTGRTIRAAINEIFDYGRPTSHPPGRAGRSRRAPAADLSAVRGRRRSAARSDESIELRRDDSRAPDARASLAREV